MPSALHIQELAAFGTALLASLLATPIVRRVAVMTGNIDRPQGLKIHTRATPLMGGVAVYVAFAAACALALPHTKPVIGVVAGGLVAVAVGLLDEYRPLPPLVHLGGQIVAAGSALVFGIGLIHYISMPFERLTSPGWQVPAVLGLGLTLLWIVSMMNTMNFLDGMDGLTPGVALIAVLLLAVWAWDPRRFGIPVAGGREDVLLPLALAGAILGFLPYNWHPARIFLGDSGSMFLGLAVGAIAIVGPAKLATALLVLLIPVLDVAWAIFRRQLRGRSFLAGDKQHVYHRMLELGMGYTTTVLLLYAICIALGIIDLLLVKQWKLLAFVLLAVSATGLFVYLELRVAAVPGGRRRSPVKPVNPTD